MTDIDELMESGEDTVQRNVHQTKSALVTAKASLADAEAKLKVVRKEETLDENTGVSLDKYGKSLAKLNCLIINGRDMPVMNTFNGKSDAYVEMTLDPPSLCPSFKPVKSETQWGTVDPVFQFEAVVAGLEGNIEEGRIKIDVFDDVENLEKLIKKKTLMGTVHLNLADLMDQEMNTAWYPMDIPEKLRKQSNALLSSVFGSNDNKEVKIGAIQIKSTLFLSSITPLIAEIDRLKASLTQLETDYEAAEADLEAFKKKILELSRAGENVPLVKAKKPSQSMDPNKLVLAPQEGEIQLRVHRALLRKPFTTNITTPLLEGADIEAQYNSSPCYFQAQILKVNNEDNTYDIRYLDSTVNTNEPDFFDQYGILRRKDGEGTPLKAAGEEADAEEKQNWFVSLVFGEPKKDDDDLL